MPDWGMVNISRYSDGETANTNYRCALQRAVSVHGALGPGRKSILELCVGPSLPALNNVYKSIMDVDVWGNDIDPRWNKGSNWLPGDAIKVFKANHHRFDAVVFAPPLSRECSGERGDSLQIFDVRPGYYAFTSAAMEVGFNGIMVLVLPGRSLSTKDDRRQFFHLKQVLEKTHTVKEFPLVDGCTKYVDLHLRRR